MATDGSHRRRIARVVGHLSLAPSSSSSDASGVRSNAFASIGGVPESPDVAGMPAVGLGLWKAAPGATRGVVLEALRMGYRHLDCACDYGNEREVGEAIRRALDEGVCRREDLFITSKLWNTYHRREHVPMACQRSLDDLGLDYLDLYLVHFPIAQPFVPFEQAYPPEWTDQPGNSGIMHLDRVPYRETWEAMEMLVDAGKARRIGVCNLGVQGMIDVMSYCRIRPAVNQVENHPYLTQRALVEFCRGHGVGVTGFSPLGATSYLSIGMSDSVENVLEDPVVTQVAAAHGKSAAQVCLRFQLQRGIAVIPKSQSPHRLRENLSVCDFELSSSEMNAIAKLDRGRRFNDPGEFTKQLGMRYGCPIYD